MESEATSVEIRRLRVLLIRRFEISAWQRVAKQQVWRRLHHGLAVLRDRLAPLRAG